MPRRNDSDSNRDKINRESNHPNKISLSKEVMDGLYSEWVTEPGDPFSAKR